MPQAWINPIAWDINLVHKLVAAGWDHIQVDCEGGCVDERHLLMMAQLQKAHALTPIFRIPPDGRYLFDKILKFGGTQFLLSGGYTPAFVQAVSHTLAEHRDACANLYVMIESPQELASIAPLCSLPHVTGFHFGLVDLARASQQPDWRDAQQWSEELAGAIEQIKNHGKTCGSYFLPAWRGSSFEAQLDIRSYSVDEFCRM